MARRRQKLDWVATAQRMRWEKRMKIKAIAKELGRTEGAVCQVTKRYCDCSQPKALGLKTCQRCHDIESANATDERTGTRGAAQVEHSLNEFLKSRRL